MATLHLNRSNYNSVDECIYWKDDDAVITLCGPPESTSYIFACYADLIKSAEDAFMLSLVSRRVRQQAKITCWYVNVYKK